MASNLKKASKAKKDDATLRDSQAEEVLSKNPPAPNSQIVVVRLPASEKKDFVKHEEEVLINKKQLRAKKEEQEAPVQEPSVAGFVRDKEFDESVSVHSKSSSNQIPGNLVEDDEPEVL